MSIAANSYGSADRVAANTPRYTNGGVFDTTTRPTLAHVETWIDDISGIVNTLLADEGFTIPVSQSDCVSMLAGLVAAAVGDKADYSNRVGRFWTESAQDHGTSIEKSIRREISEWISAHADGIENLGAERAATGGAERTFSHTPKRTDGYSINNPMED